MTAQEMGVQKPRLILFARFPVAGKVKTRLIPALGAEGATALHRRLVLRALRTAQALCASNDTELEIRFAGERAHEIQHWLGDGWRFRAQCEGDLGQRMAQAFAESLREGSPATVVIGSDCPSLTPEKLRAAFDALKRAQVVFGPANDGGYYLIGLTRAMPELFQGVAWGTEKVLTQSVQILAGANISHELLPPLDDVDRPADLVAWRRMIEAEEMDLSRVTIIIPALNEGAHIESTLAGLLKDSAHEVIVVDGGSQDETCALAEKSGAMVMRSAPGRARQMNAGAARATGSVLLFLHADTELLRGWQAVVTQILSKEGVVAGAFGFRISGSFRGQALVERAANIRSRWLQSPYGDQGLFLRRSVFEELGGFADLPIMEDYEFNQRLRKLGKVTTAHAAVVTSGRRWKRLGIVRTTFINQLMIAGFHLGVRPEKLARIYRLSGG